MNITRAMKKTKKTIFKRSGKMKLFQVEDPTGTNSTDWFCTVAEARKNAFELD